jgi:hypothetical protein
LLSLPSRCDCIDGPEDLRVGIGSGRFSAPGGKNHHKKSDEASFIHLEDEYKSRPPGWGRAKTCHPIYCRYSALHMPKATDFPAIGKVLSRDDTSVLFNPQNTTYELKLMTSNYDGPIGQRVEGFIVVSARKVYTVPSGGNFIQPIFGPPRIVQGRVKYLDEKEMVVQAGAPIIVQLPMEEDAFDLVNGDLMVASLVNVVALPGARFFQGVEAATARPT